MGSERPDGFTYTVRGTREVVIEHRGRVATVLRGAAMARFLDEVEREDDQEVMARVTGNYKRGNERLAASHPRNRQRR